MWRYNAGLLACASLHNHVMREMPTDPLEETLGEDIVGEDLDGDIVTFVETCNTWTSWGAN